MNHFNIEILLLNLPSETEFIYLAHDSELCCKVVNTFYSTFILFGICCIIANFIDACLVIILLPCSFYFRLLYLSDERR